MVFLDEQPRETRCCSRRYTGCTKMCCCFRIQRSVSDYARSKERSTSMQSRTIPTTRTVLRPATLADTPALHALWTAPGLRRYLWDDTIIDYSQSLALVERSNMLFAEHGFGLWAAHSRETWELWGFAGFVYFYDPPVLELCYGLTEEQWGRGLATEICAALVRYGVETLDLLDIRASVHVANGASIRVLHKLGFVPDERSPQQNDQARAFRLPRGGLIS